MKSALEYVPLGISLAWLFFDGPRFFVDDVQFLIEVLILTCLTRSVGVRLGVSALAWGIGVVAPLTVAIGWALSSAGLEMTSGAGNGVIVPVVEELGKLLPIAAVAMVAGRLRPTLLNASDLLVLGCMSGAGFSMVESSYFEHVRTGVRYAPHVAGLNLLPAAWGAAGYIGHAAATGFVAVCLGLGLSLKRAYGVSWWWGLPVAAFAWIVLEHGLANSFVNTGSRALMILGAGRLTPWLLLAAVAAAIVVDAGRAKATFARSKEAQKRRVLIDAYLARERGARRFPGWRQILAIVAQLRLLNLTAAFDTGRPQDTMAVAVAEAGR
jgi:RsiW-degrading membrane proteinase PrsW (M82 family)